jgi:hypothetical protein
VKYLISISLILIYLAGTLQSTWVLVDFYWNRDDYTQKHCQFIDLGITQCRASCYLDNLLKEKEDKDSDAKIISNQKVKLVEITDGEKINIDQLYSSKAVRSGFIAHQYRYDFLPFIFHPPKA